MKFNKYLIGGMLFTLTTAVGTSSCSDSFLDENYKSGYLTDYFDTEQGVLDLAASLYGIPRYWFAYEWSYATTQYGCDEFEVGTDNSNECWNIYNAALGPTVVTVNGNTTTSNSVWDEMYYGIASANTVIAKADLVTDQTQHDMILGEGYFLRGYNYYRLCAQYGSVVLQTEPVEGVVRSFTRSSEEECLAQVISDLEQAYELLPETSNTSLRGLLGWTKYTAAHFLAKALLLRVSERNDDWNSSYKTADLERIITLCDDVINHKSLAPDFRDLWNWTGIDCSAEYLDELLMVAEFNGASVTQGRYGNEVNRYFNCQFHNNVFGGYIQRGQWIGHNYQRCRPTEYNMMVYDKVNDSRFWKSTRTVYNANLESTTAINPATGTNYNVGIGDPVIIFICNGEVNESGTGIDYYWNDDWNGVRFGMSGSCDFTYNGKDVPNAIVHYNGNLGGHWRAYIDNASGSEASIPKNAFVSISKFEDGSRTSESGIGYRDGILARVGETYLIKAEALVRQGNYQEAIDVVNILRARAQYKAGEDRTLHTDGTQAFENASNYVQYQTMYEAYSKVNSYVLSTGVTSTDATNLQIASYRQLPKEDEYILSLLGCTDDYDRMLNFIMNERTRELNGEFVRWEDLSRTELLVRRTYAFNTECAASGTLDEHHELRPIPQSFIDGLLNEDGSNLTDEQRAALQNPGY